MTSFMGVMASEENFNFSVEQVERALVSSGYFELFAFTQRQPPPESESRFIISAELLYQSTSYEVEITVEPTKNLNLLELGSGNYISKTEMKKAILQTEYVSCAVNFNGKAIDDFLFQLKVLHSIVPNPSVVIDFMSWCLLSGEWLKMTAVSLIPPSPDYLYCIHAVNNGDGDNRRYWLHTHGLLRCGSVELEMVDLRNGAEYLAQLLRVTANLFLEKIPNENEEFTIGYDGLGVKLCWRRWEDVVPTIPENTSGGLNDHKEDGNGMSGEPAGVIFASQEGELCSPEIYVSTLKKDLLFFITNEETKRMGLMAKERFPILRDTFNQYGNNSGWTFLVKLGYNTDNETIKNEKEHLWFQLLAIDGDKLYAELINDPYWIKRFKRGEREVHDISHLTDWVICPPNENDEAYTPDSIYRMYQK